MQPLASLFAHLFDREPLDPSAARRRAIHREWDRQRSNALSPADQAEIDAIFARNL